ncbi:unnamed protein product [Periconia digitata]|uniref:Uncharacterized protein n=1 Tax=Periconia digitata TaxID=1303443 RepID=A0A9W4XLH0_9PLEO|nr:unnamed protein product [Periconia digitata]
MKFSVSTVVIVGSIITQVSAWPLELFSNRECGLSLRSIDLPDEAGCTTIVGDDPAYGYMFASPPSGSCVVSLYLDESCNSFISIINSDSVANSCEPANSQIVAFTVDSC